MDKTDKRIIECLGVDGNLTNAAISRAVDCSEETVRRRLNRMTQEGSLRRVAIPNDAFMGLGTTALIGIQVPPGKTEAVGELLADIDSVRWVRIISGSQVIMFEIVTTDVDSLYSTCLHEIGTIDGVLNIDTHIVMSSPKMPFAA